jgi:hypothetical protein
MTRLAVSDIRFAEANAALRSRGLLGWICLSLGDSFQLNCLALRRTAAGEYALSFPSRTDERGIMHPFYRPISDEVRRDVLAQVLGELRRRGKLR